MTTIIIIILYVYNFEVVYCSVLYCFSSMSGVDFKITVNVIKAVCFYYELDLHRDGPCVREREREREKYLVEFKPSSNWSVIAMSTLGYCMHVCSYTIYISSQKAPIACFNSTESGKSFYSAPNDHSHE